MQPEVISRKEFEHRQRTHIEPFIRNEYEIWKDQHKDSKHKLTVLGLQKYYDSRKAAFEAEGGNPDLFKNTFDRIDVGVASDSWHDLDSELQRENIYGSDNNMSILEIRKRAKEETRQNKELEHEYEKDLQDEENRHAAAG